MRCALLGLLVSGCVWITEEELADRRACHHHATVNGRTIGSDVGTGVAIQGSSDTDYLGYSVSFSGPWWTMGGQDLLQYGERAPSAGCRDRSEDDAGWSTLGLLDGGPYSRWLHATDAGALSGMFVSTVQASSPDNAVCDTGDTCGVTVFHVDEDGVRYLDEPILEGSPDIGALLRADAAPVAGAGGEVGLLFIGTLFSEESSETDCGDAGALGFRAYFPSVDVKGTLSWSDAEVTRDASDVCANLVASDVAATGELSHDLVVGLPVLNEVHAHDDGADMQLLTGDGEDQLFGYHIDVADCDGDGALDLLVGAYPGRAHLYWGPDLSEEDVTSFMAGDGVADMGASLACGGASDSPVVVIGAREEVSGTELRYVYRGDALARDATYLPGDSEAVVDLGASLSVDATPSTVAVGELEGQTVVLLGSPTEILGGPIDKQPGAAYLLTAADLFSTGKAP